MRLFTVGQGTRSRAPLPKLGSVVQPWTVASSAAVGGKAWKTFSAVCWLFGKQVHDSVQVPVGLISSNWGGTPIEDWVDEASGKQCSPARPAGILYNAMIHPFTVGPMRMTGLTWYQGESNVGRAQYYSCAFPAMIAGWRAAFQQQLWFGFVQIAGYQYVRANLPSADLRQAQLSSRCSGKRQKATFCEGQFSAHLARGIPLKNREGATEFHYKSLTYAGSSLKLVKVLSKSAKNRESAMEFR